MYMSAVFQNVQGDMLESIPLLQEVFQNMITDLVDVFSVNKADRPQVGGLNEDLTSNIHYRFLFVNDYSCMAYSGSIHRLPPAKSYH